MSMGAVVDGVDVRTIRVDYLSQHPSELRERVRLNRVNVVP